MGKEVRGNDESNIRATVPILLSRRDDIAYAYEKLKMIAVLNLSFDESVKPLQMPLVLPQVTKN